MSRPPVALVVDPVNPVYERDFLFDPRAGAGGGDDVNGAWRVLRRSLEERGVPVHTADLLERGEVPRADRYVYISAGARSRYRKLAARPDVDPVAFFVFECPIVEPKLYLELDEIQTVFRHLYSFSHGTALRPFLRRHLEFKTFRLPQPFDAVDEGAWCRGDRRFMAMINANKLPRLYVSELYTERLRAVEYFGRHGEIDLYGIGWDGPPYQMGETRVPATVRRLHRAARIQWERVRPPTDPLRVASLRAYRGPAASKTDTLAGYTFAICFENMILDGWVTEKVFDCFRAGTVPVYLGAPDIEMWVPKECFVDMRRFPDFEALRDHLKTLTRAEVEAYRAAGREYFRSEHYRPFTAQAFADLIGNLVWSGGHAR